MGPHSPGGDGCSDPEYAQFEWSAANDVNASGTAVGETLCVAEEYLTFRWSERTGMEQLANYPGGYPIFGSSINNRGYIAATTFVNRDTFYATPIIWTPDNALKLLGAHRSGRPVAINDLNVVVGRYLDGGSVAWRWSASTGIVALPALGDRVPVAINRSGNIAAQAPTGSVILSVSGELKTIDGFSVSSMNDQRQLAGATGSWPTLTAAVWSQAAGIRTLGTLGGSMSAAYSINNSGEVVGSSTTASGELHAFYWSPSRGMVDLGPGQASGIGDRGHMVGTAPSGLFDRDENEVWHATIWRGTGGVAPSGMTARSSAVPTGRVAACINTPASWQSKSGMFRCLAGGTTPPGQ